jgi:cell division transport system permease protein
MVIGVVGLVIISGKERSDFIKENMTLEIFLRDSSNPDSVKILENELKSKDYTKNLEYISKEQAKEIYIAETGDNFSEILEENPLPASLKLNLKADFVNNESIAQIESEISDNYSGIILEISRKKELIEAFNENVLKITVILGGICLLLLLVMVTLINNTILLSIYSKRFLIKTMQMVGAKPGFIRMPFIKQGFLYGLLGATIADLILLAGSYNLKSGFPDFFATIPIIQVIILFTFVLVFGIFISVLSSWFAVNKFLRKATGSLY